MSCIFIVIHAIIVLIFIFDNIEDDQKFGIKVKKNKKIKK